MERKMSAENWNGEIDLLRANGVTLAGGLSKQEFEQAETLHDFRFPPDLRSFLSEVLPVGDSFPDWRNPDSDYIFDRLAWPFHGIAYDIQQNNFWFPDWGIRPADLAEAIERARTSVADAPKLIPIYGHRYISEEPHEAGNPVFSVYQTDIIYYGNDLRRYLRHEFRATNRDEAILGEPRNIRFWTDFMESYT